MPDRDDNGNSVQMSGEKIERKPWKIGCLTYFVVIVIVLIVLVWFNFLRSGSPLRISKETTYITEPLTPDGRFVDYFAALEQRVYPPEMRTDDNGFRVVFRALGDFTGETRDPALLRQRYEKLGLDFIRDKPTLTYVEPDKFFRNRYISHPEDFADIVPTEAEPAFDPANYWLSLAKSPDLHKNAIAQQWLAENGAALDLVSEQAKKPVFVTPYVTTGESMVLLCLLLPDAQNMRAFARGLDARACIRVGEGDFDGAIDDILACYRLGRHEEQQATLIECLVGLSMDGIGHDIPFDTNPEVRANAEQLKRLRDELAALTPRKGFVHKLETERFTFLDILTSIARNQSFSGFTSGSGGAVDKTISIVGLDWNLIFKKANKVFDEMTAGTYSYPPPSMNPTRLLTLGARSELVADIFIEWFLPAVEAANEAYRRTDCSMNLKRIVLAMHLYERDHGTLPPAFSVDAEGKPLHGWRTLLLPYFGEETLDELYAQIRLDEPWDSEHNSQFHETNLDVYRCPSYASLKDGETSYAVVTGDGLLFTEDGQGQTLAGHGVNMLMVVERNDAACWMRPAAEVPQTLAETGRIGKGPGSVGSRHTGGANFGMRNGAVPFLSETINAEVFRNLIRGTAKERP